MPDIDALFTTVEGTEVGIEGLQVSESLLWIDLPFGWGVWIEGLSYNPFGVGFDGVGYSFRLWWGS